MRWTQSQRVVFSIVNYEQSTNMGKGLELTKISPVTNRANVTYNGNNVGYTIAEYEIDEHTYLVLTLDKYLLPDRVARQLVKEANSHDIKVVFVTSIDFGFGTLNKPLTIKEQRRLLARVASFSTDDIKTAATVGYYTSVDREMVGLAYTYNQILTNGEDSYYSLKLHAEDVLATFCEVDEIPIDQRRCWLMELEPCERCLRALLDRGAKVINYFTLHKDKWNTPAYLQLVNDIHANIILSSVGHKIIYSKETH